MTLICGGGTSSGKPGAAANIVFDAGLIAAGLEAISPWLTPFVALIESFTYEIVSQCSTDPPAMPVFDATDITNLIGGILNPNLFTTLNKVHDALLNYAWYQYCKCDTPPTPAQPPALPAPVGYSFQTPANSQPCFNGSIGGLYPQLANTALWSDYTDVTQQVLPVTAARQTIVDGHGSYQIYGIPKGPQQIAFEIVFPHFANCSTISCGSVGFRMWDATPTLIFDGGFGCSGSGLSRQCVINEPAGHPTAAYWNASVAFLIGSGCTNCNTPVQLTTQVFCGADAGSIQTCCPPDPSIMTGIQNILSSLEFLISATPSPPHGYVAGTVHSNLSNTGNFALIGPASAVRVHFNTFPSGTAVKPGTPDFYWDAGFITPFGDVYPMRSSRIVFQDQIITIPTVTTNIGYTLLHGTNIDVTELFPA